MCCQAKFSCSKSNDTILYMEIRREYGPVASCFQGHSIKVIGTDTYPSTAYDFLLVIHSNRGHISYTVSEINCVFRRKSQFFPPLAFSTLYGGGSPWNFATAMRLKYWNNASTMWWKKFEDICLRLDTVPQCDGRTDVQTDRNGKTISRSACWRAIKSDVYIDSRLLSVTECIHFSYDASFGHSTAAAEHSQHLRAHSHNKAP